MKKVKRITILLMIMVLVFGWVRPAFAKTYSYEVKPIVNNFNYYLYVRTDNPDPASFRIVDKNSKYSDDSNTQAVYSLEKTLFLDVVYEKETAYRVKGGYIFCNAWESDGGQLTVQEKNGNGWKDVKTVNCVPLRDSIDYLIETYTKNSMTFFEKMDAIQRGLDSISVYPRSVLDTDMPNKETPYPCFVHPYYADQHTLFPHYDVYEYSDKKVFASLSYPYVLHSLTFPGLLAAVAKRLNPRCVVEYNEQVHYLISVTDNGVTKSYGGAGEGGSNPVYSKDIEKCYKFDNSGNDYCFTQDISLIRSKLFENGNKGDKRIESLREQLYGEPFRKAIGKGSWIKTYSSYAYVPYGTGGSFLAEGDVWVDGRYIDSNLWLQLGETFDQHPKASIILHNISYTDINGKAHTNDVLYSYFEDYDCWMAPFYYVDNRSYIYSVLDKLPGALVLTKDQVSKMKLDANTRNIPESGKSYTGKVRPGTPFKNILVKGLTIRNTEVILGEGDSSEISADINPSNATDKRIVWESSNENVATVYDGIVHAYKKGSAVITATTVDGNYKKTCKVTVKQGVESLSIDETYVVLEEGESITLQVNVNPANAYNKTLRYSAESYTEGSSVVKVDKNGKVTAVSPGYGRVVVESSNGKRAYVSFTVKPSTTRISLKTSSISLMAGDNYTIQAKVESSDLSDKSVVWSSSNSKIASVDNNGKVTAKSAGSATITATTKIGNKKASCLVTVINQDVQKTLMHRLYNPNSGEHFYTASKGEKDGLVRVGWQYEGIGWAAPKTSKTPVYRLYNKNAGDHHYTMNKKERDWLISLGWNDEGIGWYSDDKKGIPLYRQYNPNAISGSHNYTVNKKENDWLVSLGWQEEGIGWYGLR